MGPFTNFKGAEGCIIQIGTWESCWVNNRIFKQCWNINNWKYTSMVHKWNTCQLFGICYTHTPSTSPLCSIINFFKDVIGVQNIIGVIIGIPILLFENSNRRITASIADFYNCKNFHNIVLQGVCDCDKLIWNVFASQLSGVANGGSFKLSSLYRNSSFRKFLQNM